MIADPQTQAVLLLTAWLDKSSREKAKPLSTTEWGRFASWLNAQKRTPADFLGHPDLDQMLEGWSDPDITPDRIEALLARSATLGFVLEKWERAGLWVMSRAHPDYPRKLKTRLGFNAPAVLVGCGDRSILSLPAIAVVGSRDAAEADLEFAAALARASVADGHAIVSGGARGVDEAAMLGALESGGRAIGILPDNLLRASTSAKFRPALASEQLVLVSPFNPDAGFNAGNAMARNKYIYCCADAAVVVASGVGKGGTWSGAIEALRAGWVPVWARNAPASPPGNAALIQKGARDFGIRVASPRELVNQDSTRDPQESLFAAVDGREPESEPLMASPPTSAPPPATAGCSVSMDQLSFVEFFAMKFAVAAGPKTMNAAEIASTLELNKTQVSAWLAQAEEQGLVIKLSRPVRYQASPEILRRWNTPHRCD